MTAGVVFAVRYFSLDADLVQHEILCKHVLDICIYLTDRIDIFISCQLCKHTVDKCRRLIGAILLGQLHRLVDGNADRHILIVLHLIDCQAGSA